MFGLNSICNICGRKIMQEDIDGKINEKGKVIKKPGNGPDKIRNIPGYVHRRCKAEFDTCMIGTGRVTKVFTEQELKGE